MATIYRHQGKWAVAFRLKGHPRQYVYGIATRALALQVKHQKQHEEHLARAGLLTVDPRAAKITAAEKLPLKEHVAAFKRDLLARGRNAQYTHQQNAHVTQLLRIARVRSLSEIAVEAIQSALHRLLSAKCGPTTCNRARQAIIQFERFLRRSGKIDHTVLHDLVRFNEAKDIRRQRRALSQEEVDWFLKVTSTRRDPFWIRFGIRPADRAVMYGVGLATGYRQGELLSLTPESFVVGTDIERPLIRLSAEFSKSGKNREQAISPDLAAALREWLASKPPRQRVWQMSQYARPAIRFRRDMEAARAAWIADATTPEERQRREASNTLKYVYHDGIRNVWADFHGLRHTGITFAVRAGGIRVGQVWAGHSTPVLTAKYAHVEAADLDALVEELPQVGSGFKKKGGDNPKKQ